MQGEYSAFPPHTLGAGTRVVSSSTTAADWGLLPSLQSKFLRCAPGVSTSAQADTIGGCRDIRTAVSDAMVSASGSLGDETAKFAVRGTGCNHERC